MKQAKEQEVFVVLDNIRSVYNVGSIFRTADCLGVSGIILIGVTPTPTDRFGRSRKDFAKVSLGAEYTVPWKYHKTISEVVRSLKEKNFSLVAVEQAANSVDYKKVKPEFPAAFIFGNEVEGISAQTLKKCDVVAEIPMCGQKESLNVSITAGIALSRMLNR